MDKKEEKLEVHGNHWNALIKDFDKEMSTVLVKAANNPKSDYLIKPKKDYFAIIAETKPLSSIILVENQDQKSVIISSYPFININNRVELEITEIEGWGNGLEAVIHAAREEHIVVSFFDVFYFFNKEKYQIGKKYIFNLAALGYSAEEQKPQEFKMDEGPAAGETFSTKGMTAYLPRNDYRDDFQFSDPVKNTMEKINYNNTDFLIFPFELRHAAEDKLALKFPIYIRKDLFKSILDKGQDIGGTGWLQGYLDGTLEKIYIKPKE